MSGVAYSNLMKQLDSKRLYDGRWSLHLDTIELANGTKKETPRIDHPGSVVMVPIIGDQVVMLRQYRHALGQTILELPAGTLERGEVPLPAAQRELREETGYRADQLILLSQLWPAPGSTNELMNTYLATGLSADPLEMDDDEVIETVLMPLTQLVDMALTGQLADAKSVAGILQAHHYLQTNVNRLV